MEILLYNLFLLSVVPFYPAVKFAARRRGDVSLFKRFNANFPQMRGKILLHLSSIGEVNSVKPLVNRLKEQLTITLFTDYGLERAREAYPEIPARLLPIDLYPIVKKFLERNQPRKILIYETEIWPSLIHVAGRMGIPVFMVSGKISEKSFRNYKKFKFFLHPFFKNVTFLARSKADLRRAEELGFKRAKLVGDLKFDVEKPGKKLELFIEGKRKVVVWGSTHRGEEELAFKIHKNLKKKFPNILTVIAPRHVRRAKDLKPPSSFLFRSETKTIPESAEFYIVDTVGELSSLYRIADVVIIGGSFVPKVGGHNPVEAALWKKPVISGNYGEDFCEVAKRLNVPILKEREVLPFVEKLFTDETFYKKVSETIFNSYEQERGVTGRILKAIGE